MTFETVPSLVRLFLDQAHDRTKQPFLWRKRDGSWQPQSYGSVADDIRRLARGLVALGIGAGDRVALV